MFVKLEFVELSAKCKTQSGKRRVCDAIIMPPSDEGGGTSIASDGGRDRLICLLNLSLILTSFDSSPSRVEPNIAFPLRGEGVTAGDGRGVPIIPTNSILQHRHDIFRFQLSTLHLSHSPLKKSQIKIKLPIDK